MTATIQRLSLVAAFFVCPLLFFTNLTRNPYSTQICLLNIVSCAAVAARFLWRPLKGGGMRLPRTPLDASFAAAAGVAALSWLVAFLGHPAFFRASIVSEGVRITLFAVVNAVFPFYLAASLMREDGEAAGPQAASPAKPASRQAGREPPPEEYPVGGWAVLALAWGGLWVLFPQLRSTRPPLGIWECVWDGYGALVWLGGFGAAAWLCRAGRALDFLHLALMSGFLASVYGVLQYFNVEFVWPSILNPYGGRSVSTFGNPNFLSSYNVVLLPLAAVFFVRARGLGRRLVYGAAFLALGTSILASLTRSSWGGAAAALGLLALSRDFRSSLRENPRPAGLLAGLALMILLLWPESRVGGSYHPSVLGRITEISSMNKTEGHYTPLHQRALIWSAAFLMGDENPVSGKGWGLFELFYPFYQGHLMDAFPFFQSMRTHANNSHNEVLEVWAQTGLLGLGVLFWLWTAFFAASARRLGSTRGPREAAALGAACGAGGMLADNLLNVSLHFAMPGFMFWWAAGAAMGAAGPSERPWRGEGPAAGPRRLPARLAAAVAGALLLLVSWYWVCTWFREIHYFAGFKLMRSGSAAAAVRELEKSRRWGPREVNAIYELGNAYARLERYADAAAAYEEALRTNAGYDEIYFNIATIKASRLDKAGEASKYYQSALAINPVSPDVYSAMTALFLQEPRLRLDEAEPLLDKAIKAFPRNPNHWNNLGFVMSRRGRWAEAERAYVRALELSPDLQVAEGNLRNVLRQAGRPDPPVLQAVGAVREAERRLSAGDYSDAALAAAARAGRAFPEVPKVRFLLGTLLLARGGARESLEHLAWAADRDPGLVGARLNLARAHLKLGLREEAVRDLQAVLGVDPRNADALNGLRALGAAPRP